MLNFQDIISIWTQTYMEIFKSALMHNPHPKISFGMQAYAIEIFDSLQRFDDANMWQM